MMRFLDVMKRSAVVAVCLGMCAALPGGSALAQAGGAGLSHMTGEIAAVDLLGQKITVRHNFLMTTDFVFNDQTAVVEGNSTLTLQDLQKGDKVTIHYVEEGGQRVSQRIELESAGMDRQAGSAAPASGQPEAAPTDPLRGN